MSPDPFEFDDAPYLLGALAPAERAAFEEHLVTCAACTRRVADLREVTLTLHRLTEGGLTEADLMEADLVETRVFDVGPPDTLLPGLLRRAAAERRRRRTLIGALAGLAAACLVALVVAVWPTTPSGSGSTHPQAMTALVTSPVRASATLVDRQWGTEIDLSCSYRGPVDPAYAYGLSVVGTDGTTYQLGTWRLSTGQDTRFASGIALPRTQIARVEITADGTPILSLTT